MSNLERDRAIYFDGPKNVRDLGGLSAADGRNTRFGVIYRADRLTHASDADLERITKLGIRSVIDLRGEDEYRNAPDRLPAHAPPKIFWRGFLSHGSVEMMNAINHDGVGPDIAFEIMTRNYSRIPFDHVDEFRDIMHHLISPEGAPHLLHCTVGKDRTGIIVAMILRAVGVSVDDVVADFELSNCEHQPVDVFGANAHPESVAVIMAAHPDYIRATLTAIDSRHGDFNGYLEAELGYGPRERAALADLFLE